MINVFCKRAEVTSGFARITMIFQHEVHNNDQTCKCKNVVQETHDTARLLSALRTYWMHQAVMMRRTPGMMVPSAAVLHLSALPPWPSHRVQYYYYFDMSNKNWFVFFLVIVTFIIYLLHFVAVLQKYQWFLSVTQLLHTNNNNYNE